MSGLDNSYLKFDDEYDIIIIGAGIGGLLTAANLINTGKKICIIERLGFIGGRFTSIPYKGFSISTGAIHLLPHGGTGPLGKMLKRLIQQPISKLKNHYFLRKDGNVIKLKKGWPSYIGSVIRDRFKVVSATAKYVRDGRPTTYSALEYLTEGNVSEDYIAHIGKFTNFTLSLDLNEIPAYHLGYVHRSFIRHWKPGQIIGGCGNVIQRLAKLIDTDNIDLRTNIIAKNIILTDRAV
ncbi:MAG: NAD(P)-binding protein, partial [Thermoplasmata archaeon]|nr:NAD(P)-binding protein [Thermoplasmata archaeon]